MKRIGNLYQQICSLENLHLADMRARDNKKGQKGIVQHDKNREANIVDLRQRLLNKTYQTSPYKTFVIHDPKERVISCLPYIDRIVHHAIMNVLEPIFVATFTGFTYSCIKGRGIHAASKAVKKALKNENETRYCLKLDIRKFYPSVDRCILKNLLRRKFKDADLLWLLDGIIDSSEGLPIGNYISSYFANFYLCFLDHYIKEVLRVKHVFRYADDFVILSDNKKRLHEILKSINQYLQQKLKLTLKPNYQIFPVSARGIDFVGYKHFHTHTLIRTEIKKRFARKLKKGAGQAVIASYNGWIQHCNGVNLMRKLTSKRA